MVEFLRTARVSSMSLFGTSKRASFYEHCPFLEPPNMVVVGKHLFSFAYCGLVVEIQPLNYVNQAKVPVSMDTARSHL